MTVKLACAMLAIAVTNEAAVVLKLVAPADVAPVGAAKVTFKVTPVGMLVASAAVIFLAVLFVVTAYVVVASVALVGALPAVAVVTFKGPGFPETEMESIEPIVYVTVEVAVVAPISKAGLKITAESILRIVLWYISKFQVKFK